MTHLKKFCGKWLVTRSDTVNVPKGCYIQIEELKNSTDSVRFKFYSPWSLEVTVEGVAFLHGEQLQLTSLLPPWKRRKWRVFACVAVVDRKKFLFGIDIHGDPENTGVWGAEDESGGGGPIPSA